MKKLFLFCAALLALSAQAEEITLDLSTATDMSSSPIQFETKNIPVYNGNMKDVWDSTYSDNGLAQYIYCNDAKFMFSHAGNGYNYWHGFTVSKVAADTLNQFACMAKGGMKGVGTPFVSAYFSEFESYEMSDANIMFSDQYFPKEVYICQNAYTYSSIKNGDSYAHKFTDKDTLALVISGLNENYEEVNSLTYYLAVDGKFNENWVKVELSSIDQCWGLSFRMTSTDTGQWGINTPTYFALDGLTVSTEKIISAVPTAQTKANATKRIVDGELLIERNGNTYNAAGQLLK